MGSQAITVGAIITRTIDCARANIGPIAIYLLVFGMGSIVAEYFLRLGSPEYKIVGGLIQIGFGVAGVVGGYLLIETMLKRAGWFYNHGPRSYLGYFGQSCLVGLGIGFGTLLLIIPGLILAARWSIAAPLLIGTDAAAIEGIEQSWRATKGHAGKIFLAALVMGLILVLVFGILAAVAGIGSAFGGEEESMLSLVVQSLAGDFVGALMMALGVALFGLLGSRTEQLGEVFA